MFDQKLRYITQSVNDSDMENFFSSCLRNIQYDDDCDKEIAEIKQLLEPVSFLTSFANSILKVNCESKATAVNG